MFWLSYYTIGLQLQPHNFNNENLPYNPVRSPDPSLSAHTEVSSSLFLLTSTQLPQHQITLSAWSVIHSLPDHPDHLFMCRFVSDCYPAITHCQKRPENYTSFAILIWIMYYPCVCVRVCVVSRFGCEGSSGRMLMDIYLPLSPDRGSFCGNHWLWCFCITRGHAGRSTAWTLKSLVGSPEGLWSHSTGNKGRLLRSQSIRFYFCLIFSFWLNPVAHFIAQYLERNWILLCPVVKNDSKPFTVL